MAVTPLPATAVPYTQLRFSMECPGCHRVLHIPVQYEGQMGKCKHCAHRFHAMPPGQQATLKVRTPRNNGCPPDWYEEREQHFHYCKHNYAEAVAHHPGKKRNYQWEQLLSQAKQCEDAETQKHFYWRAIDLGVNWPEPFEKLARLYAHEDDLETAFAICIRYFESDYWRRAPWYKNSRHLLHFLKKVDKRLNARTDLSSNSDL